jgi:hypothetical protein
MILEMENLNRMVENLVWGKHFGWISIQNTANLSEKCISFSTHVLEYCLRYNNFPSFSSNV